MRFTVLILVPTRELALQTSAIVREIGKHMPVECMVTTGGTTLKDDIMRLYNPVHILVGTPGRVLDLAEKGVADLSHCAMFVMDEADKLLSPEFQPILEKLIELLPAERQLCMFSATFPVTVKAFKQRYLPNAYIINLMDELTLRGITQYYAFVEERQKVHCLNTLFTKVTPTASLHFCVSCAGPSADFLLLTWFRSWRSTSRSFSAILSTVWSCSRRRSPSSDTLASTFTPR